MSPEKRASRDLPFSCPGQPVGPAIDRAARLLDVESAAGHDAPRALIVLDHATVGLLDVRFAVLYRNSIERNLSWFLLVAGPYP